LRVTLEGGFTLQRGARRGVAEGIALDGVGGAVWEVCATFFLFVYLIFGFLRVGFLVAFVVGFSDRRLLKRDIAEIYFIQG
jgi:hypothetical protein